VDVHVTEHPVPGPGQLFHLELSDGSVVALVVEPSGRRELSITLTGEDEVSRAVALTEAEALALGALLSGVHFVIERRTESLAVDAVDVRTMTVGRRSPAVGRRLAELDVPNREAADVIAVVRDDTPELIEDDKVRVCEPGDRLVLIGRPAALEQLCRFLAG
jgi:K+/H+ antiporter YhaU regulatory subunit KhtT